MESWQERVIDERKQLDDKIAKLLAFLEGPQFFKLAEGERARLRRQYGAMKDYSQALEERIDAFSAVPG